MIEVLQECIAHGLMFHELFQLHDQIIRYFISIAKIHTLLKVKPEILDEETERKFFFNPEET